MATYELGFTEADVLLFEKNLARGILSATTEDGTSITFPSLSAMRTHANWLRSQLGIANTASSGYVSINANMGTTN